ncbi:MAG: MBL fold metallo-hydrolase [Candidatus Hodarchaeota archaeon]
MRLLNIKDRVWADTSGENGGNYGAVILADEIVMVDTGMMHSKTKVVKDFLEEKFSLPIKKAIYTHWHSDHVFGAQALGDVTLIASAPMRSNCDGALNENWTPGEIAAWADEIKDSRPELAKDLGTLEIRLPEMLFEDTLMINNDLTIKLLGGHTAGSSIVIVEPEHVVFIGDLIFSKSFPYAGDSTCNPNQWIQALEEVMERDFEIIISGHGPICDNEELRVQIEFLSKLREEVNFALKEGLSVGEFIEQGRTPEFYKEGVERRLERALVHWFKFYS